MRYLLRLSHGHIFNLSSPGLEVIRSRPPFDETKFDAHVQKRPVPTHDRHAHHVHHDQHDQQEQISDFVKLQCTSPNESIGHFSARSLHLLLGENFSRRRRFPHEDP
ncbi:unnamed protein product, partial [Mycena citricolor]